MEVNYKSANGQFEVTFDVKTQTELFESLAEFQEVFEVPVTKIAGVDVKPEDVVFRVREVDGNKFYERAYVGSNPDLWGYKQQFGQNKKGGTLFLKKFLTDEEKATHDDGKNGWRRFKNNK